MKDIFIYNKDYFRKPALRYTLDPFIPRNKIPDYPNSYFYYRLKLLPVWKSVEIKVSYRPDLVAWDYYKNADLANIILLYNSIPINLFLEGRTINLFSLSDYESMVSSIVTRRV